LNIHEDMQIRLVIWEIASEDHQRLLYPLLHHDVVRVVQQDLQRRVVVREHHQMPRVSVRNVATDDFNHGNRRRGSVNQGGGRGGGNELLLDQLDCFLGTVINTYAQEELTQNQRHFGWSSTLANVRLLPKWGERGDQEKEGREVGIPKFLRTASVRSSCVIT
jgi:hypothetical protein